MVAGEGRTILVVDDDDLFRESLEQNLRDVGFRVHGFADGPSVLRHLEEEPAPDLVILDWRMPGMNGIEVLRHMRARKADVPVLFLTALSDQIYEETALIGGAVDFVEKSRSFAILERRIDLITAGPKGRASEAAAEPDSAVERFGELELHPSTHRAYWRDREVDLTLTEFDVVHFLATRAGRDVRYRDIYDHVRGRGFVAGAGAEGYRANVRAYIKRIRHKFRKLDDGFDEIENYPGFGYRWRNGD